MNSFGGKTQDNTNKPIRFVTSKALTILSIFVFFDLFLKLWDKNSITTWIIFKMKDNKFEMFFILFLVRRLFNEMGFLSDRLPRFLHLTSQLTTSRPLPSQKGWIPQRYKIFKTSHFVQNWSDSGSTHAQHIALSKLIVQNIFSQENIMSNKLRPPMVKFDFQTLDIEKHEHAFIIEKYY